MEGLQPVVVCLTTLVAATREDVDRGHFGVVCGASFEDGGVRGVWGWAGGGELTEMEVTGGGGEGISETE